MRRNKKGLLKRMASLVLGAAICVSLAEAPVAFAADNTNNTEISIEATKTASSTKWTYNTKFKTPKMPKEAKNAFNKAIKNVSGATYKPVLYIGSQVVAGKNFKFLCYVTPATKGKKGSLKYVTVYKNLKGKCKVTSIQKLKLDDLTMDHVAAMDKNAAHTDMIVEPDGGLNTYQKSRIITLPKKVEKAFDDCYGDLSGSGHDPVAYLGSTTINGKKFYAVMMYTYVVVPNAKKRLAIVYVTERDNQDVILK